MSAKDIRNLPASALARLLNLSQKIGDNYQALLAKFASQRFLYRLGRSALRDRFVLKGAMLQRIWSANPYRATRDLDLLRRGEGGVEAIRVAKVDPDAGKEILGILRPFLLPILENLREGAKTAGPWPPGGPWR
jgi:hypothetical protein